MAADRGTSHPAAAATHGLAVGVPPGDRDADSAAEPGGRQSRGRSDPAQSAQPAGDTAAHPVGIVEVRNDVGWPVTLPRLHPERRTPSDAYEWTLTCWQCAVDSTTYDPDAGTLDTEPDPQSGVTRHSGRSLGPARRTFGRLQDPSACTRYRAPSTALSPTWLKGLTWPWVAGLR